MSPRHSIVFTSSALDYNFMEIDCLVHLCLFVCLFGLVFQDRASLCIHGYTGTYSVDQGGLELRLFDFLHGCWRLKLNQLNQVDIMLV